MGLIVKPRHGGVDDEALSNWYRVCSRVNVMIASHAVRLSVLVRNTELNVMLLTVIDNKMKGIKILFTFSLTICPD